MTEHKFLVISQFWGRYGSHRSVQHGPGKQNCEKNGGLSWLITTKLGTLSLFTQPFPWHTLLPDVVLSRKPMCPIRYAQRQYVVPAWLPCFQQWLSQLRRSLLCDPAECCHLALKVNNLYVPIKRKNEVYWVFGRKSTGKMWLDHKISGSLVPKRFTFINHFLN